MKKVISTEKAPAAIGPYSQAMILNGVVFTSGQIPIDPATGEITAVTIEEQAEQVMKNLGEVLKEAGRKQLRQPVFCQIWATLQHLMRYMENISQANRHVPA